MPEGELDQALQQVLGAKPVRMVLSVPRKGETVLRRAQLRPVGGGWQVERFSAEQAFHQNVRAEQLPQVLRELLEQSFSELHAFAATEEFRLRVTKKGKVLLGRHVVATGDMGGALGDGDSAAQKGPESAAQKSPKGDTAHDRRKKHLLAEGLVVPPLVDMGVLRASGQVVAAMRDKYRQINRFVELVEDVLRGYDKQSIRIVDFGCGKSYLTFVLYYYLTERKGLQVEMTGVDRKAAVVEKCADAAKKYGYNGLKFVIGDVESWDTQQPVNMVVSLHACDTATDFALAAAVRWGAQMVFSVPCCQHEVNAQMRSEKLAVLMNYGVIKERTAALLTDAMRANMLVACGYKTQLMEFVEVEHTPKNLLIRAVKGPVAAAKREKARAEVQEAMHEMGVEPMLWRLLRKQGQL